MNSVAVSEVNALGMRCPAPILAIAKALKNQPEQSSFVLLADDPATLPDIVAWARMTGNHVEASGPDEFTVTRREKI